MVAPTGVNEGSPHQPVNPETALAGLVEEELPEGGTAEAAAGLDPELMAARRPGGAPVEAGLTEAVPTEAELTEAELTEAELTEAELTEAELAGRAETRESRDISPLGVAAIIFGVIVLVGVAVGVLAVATHGFHKKTVVTYRPAAVFKLRPGDCVNSAPDGLAVTVLSCGTPHDAEVFATFALPASSWPGNTAVEQAAGNGCASRLGGYLNPNLASVGLAQEFVYPNQTAWQAGERTVVCEVSSSTGKLTGSVRKAS
jgi:hypothetical protein